MAPPGDCEATAIDRVIARVIVVDDGDRVLLLRGREGVWAMPGGGLEPGESHEAAARRELWEETSLRVASVGPWVWTRRHAWATADGVWYRSDERYHLVRTAAYTPRFARDDDPERVHIDEQRWWSQAEIAASAQTFAPRRLAGLLADLLAGRIPEVPLDVGI